MNGSMYKPSLVCILFLMVTLGSHIATVLASERSIKLKVTDVVEIRGNGNVRQAQLSRRIGIGMDSRKKQSFNIAINDVLPEGCKLLSPKIGSTQITALDGKKCPMTITSRKAVKGTELKIKIEDLPSLPAVGDCCECSGECGRACSVEFTYCISLPGNQDTWGNVTYSSSPDCIIVGKPTRVKVTVNPRIFSLKNAALALNVPLQVNSSRIAVKGYSKNLNIVRTQATSIRLASHNGIRNEKFVLELEITPMKKGLLRLGDCVNLIGEPEKAFRKAPVLEGGGTPQVKHQTHVRIICDLDLKVL